MLDSDFKTHLKGMELSALMFLVAILSLVVIPFAAGLHPPTITDVTTSGAINDVSYSNTDVRITFNQSSSVDQFIVKQNGEQRTYTLPNGTTKIQFLAQGNTDYTLIAYDDGEKVGSATFSIELANVN